MRHDAYAALRHPDYRRFAAGFVVSSTGLQMLGMAVGWEIYDRTGSAMNLGYVGLARALPVILLALPAGHLIDTFDRRRVLALTQWAFALVMIGLACALAPQAPLWITYALLVLSGCARVFNGPSRATLLPQLVPPEDFHNATAWNSGVFQFSACTGPLIGGYLIRQMHAAWPVYAVTAIACALFAILAMTLHPRLSSKQAEPWAWRNVTAGISHLWTEKTILAAITLDMFAVLLGGAVAMLPIYAKDILHTDAFGLGVLRAAPYLGAFLMAILLAHRPAFRKAGPALLWSIVGFGIATIVFGYSTSILLSVTCLAIGGAVDNISVVIRHVLVQVRTPTHLRGRVSSVNSVFIESSNELGAFESGLVAHYFGPVVSVVSGGIGTLVVVALVAIGIPQIRKLGELRNQDED